MTSLRINQATGALVLESMIKTSLVAGDAGIDFIGAILLRLEHEFGIGQEWPRHRHHVSVTLGQDLFRHFRRIDTVRGNHRDLDGALEPRRRFTERAAWH